VLLFICLVACVIEYVLITCSGHFRLMNHKQTNLPKQNPVQCPLPTKGADVLMLLAKSLVPIKSIMFSIIM